MAKRIIQNDTCSCFACVAAMITGETAEDVFKFVGHDGSVYDKDSTHPEKFRGFGYVDIVKYLIEHRYTLGTWSVFEDPADVSGFDEVQFSIKFKDNPAVLEVPSTRLGGKATHVIYWDGKKIFDPSPSAKEDPCFSEYKIIKWIPVIHFEQ